MINPKMKGEIDYQLSKAIFHRLHQEGLLTDSELEEVNKAAAEVTDPCISNLLKLNLLCSPNRANVRDGIDTRKEIT